MKHLKLTEIEDVEVKLLYKLLPREMCVQGLTDKGILLGNHNEDEYLAVIPTELRGWTVWAVDVHKRGLHVALVKYLDAATS